MGDREETGPVWVTEPTLRLLLRLSGPKHRLNVAADLKRHLMSRGGTRIEIDPGDQTAVAPRHRRDLSVRRLTVRPRHWDAAVDAWLADDEEGLDAVWDQVIHELGSEHDSYSYVSSIGWNA